MMTIVNLTPHAIVLRDANGMDHTIMPDGTVARVTSTPGTLSVVEGLPVPVATATVYGSVVGLPEPCEGVRYIVSGMVLGRVRGRSDVFAPGTGPNDGAIRNEKGHIVAVTRLLAAEV